MSVWAIADLHLSFGTPNKKMDVFGPQWENYTEKIESFWRQEIKQDDLVLIAGDISWAMHPEEAKADLDWIGNLPGAKILIKGNHDFWWGSLSKLKPFLPSSCYIVQNNSLTFENISIAGSRLWDIPGLSFNSYIDLKKNELSKEFTQQDASEGEKIYRRELNRLETSLKSLNPKASVRIAMTHYPPIGACLEETDVSHLLEKYGVSYCVFGHLHNVRTGIPLFGSLNGIQYFLTSCDYLDFRPIKIL